MSKVVFITGASGGIGWAIAKYLADRGHIVYGTSRQPQASAAAVRMLVADVTDEPGIQAALATVVREQGRLDVVINNAGLGLASPLEMVPINDVQRVFDTNVTGVIRVVQAALPYMRTQRSGLIINISSIGAEMGLPYRGVYSASKAAVDRLTESLRMELKPFGINVCTVQPGGVKTAINANRIHSVLPAGNVYKHHFDTAYGLIEKSVDEGLDVVVFGKLVADIIQRSQVKAMYRVGRPVEKLSVILKRLLPSATYEKMVRNHYGLD